MNNTIEVPDCCRVCLKNDSSLISTAAVDGDNIKLCDKLFCCISEINWFKDTSVQLLICNSCVLKLRTAYDFKILCLQSDNTLQQYFLEKNPDRNVLVIESNEQAGSNSLINLTPPEPQRIAAALIGNCSNNIDIKPDLNVSRSTTPDPLALRPEDFRHARSTVTKTCVETQTQPLLEYRTLTPAAASLEALSTKPTVVVVEEEAKYQCDMCEKKYISSTNLKIHKRTHTGEKPFACKYCENKYYHSSHLTAHLKRHTGENRFQCAVCVKRFATSTEVRLHMRMHTQEKPYACGACEKRYVKRYDLQRHMRVHAAEDGGKKSPTTTPPILYQLLTKEGAD